MSRRSKPLLALVLLPGLAGCVLFEQDKPSDCTQGNGTPTSLRNLQMGVAATLDYGFAPTLPAVGDFDGDGNADVAVADPDSGVVVVHAGDGSFGFTEMRTLGAEGNARGVTAGDLDMDGIHDLIIAGTGVANGEVLSDHIRVIYGSPDFASAAPIGYDTDPEAGVNTPLDTTTLNLADLDADGMLDVVTTTQEGGGFVFWNQGTQLMAPGERYLGTGNASHTAIADLNGDGSPTLISYGLEEVLAPEGEAQGQLVTDVIVNAFSMFDGELRQVPGTAPGTLAASTAPLGVPGITVIDFNQDARPEPVGAFNYALHVYGNINGQIADTTAFLICLDAQSDTTHVTGLTRTELDQDSTPELATLVIETGELAVFAVRSGRLTAPVLVDANLPGGDELASHDVDGDGWPEVLVTDIDGNQLHVVAVQ